MTKLSVCIIAKNEEANIENCLISVKNIADEIIVLDTGSTDTTVEIAKKYATVYQGIWENDFSKSRNECISYASGDWILIMDSDEVLTEETEKLILPFIEESKNRFAPNIVFAFKNINPSLSENEIMYHGFKHSLFRNNLGIKYKHKVHEFLYHPDFNVETLNLNNLVIMHNDSLKPHDYLTRKYHKYSYILLDLIKKYSEPGPIEEVLNESEKNKDLIYYWYQLANTYSFLNEPRKCVNAYYQALNIFDHKLKQTDEAFYVKILGSIFQPLCDLNEYSEALIYIEQFLTFLPDFPDALYYKAFCYQHLGNFQDAVLLYQEALELIKQKKYINKYTVISLEDSLHYTVLNELSKCLLIGGNNEKSLQIAQYLYSKLPESFQLTINLIKNLVINDNLKELCNITNEHSISLIDQVKLQEIVKLDKIDFRYKNYQVKLLERILMLEGIIPEERNVIYMKIESLLD